VSFILVEPAYRKWSAYGMPLAVVSDRERRQRVQAAQIFVATAVWAPGVPGPEGKTGFRPGDGVCP